MNGHGKRIIQWSTGTNITSDKNEKRTALDAENMYGYYEDNGRIKAIAAPSTTAHGLQQADTMV